MHAYVDGHHGVKSDKQVAALSHVQVYDESDQCGAVGVALGTVGKCSVTLFVLHLIILPARYMGNKKTAL
jgi:hypothetical protein